MIYLFSHIPLYQEGLLWYNLMMSEKNENNTVISEVEELFESVMKLYWAYLDQLEHFLHQASEDDHPTISALQEQIDEVQEAILHDVNLFEKAIQQDLEAAHHFQDELKINELYKKLKA